LLSKDSLKGLLHRPEFSRIDKLLLCLAVDVDKPKQVKEIKAIARAAGLHNVDEWNISGLLSNSKGKAIRVPEGWELTADGRANVANLAGTALVTPAPKAATQLRDHLATIKDLVIASFLDEAIRCLEYRLYRAAVVLSWIGAVSILHEYVIQNYLAAFNTEATRRDPKWKPARTRDDLARLKESDFLDILEDISVLGKSVKQELSKCLQLRNGCGHPSSLQIGENTVAAHIEVLLLNVFSRFKV
jgi:hypothetical protein